MLEAPGGEGPLLARASRGPSGWSRVSSRLGELRLHCTGRWAKRHCCCCCSRPFVTRASLRCKCLAVSLLIAVLLRSISSLSPAPPALLPVPWISNASGNLPCPRADDRLYLPDSNRTELELGIAVEDISIHHSSSGWIVAVELEEAVVGEPTQPCRSSKRSKHG